MGGRRRENGSLPGAGKLNSRHGLIQSAVARRVVLRNTPRLTFRLDDSAQRGVDLVNLLEDIDKNLPKAPPADAEMTGSNILPLAKARCPRPYRAGCAGTAEGRNTQNHASGKIRNGRQGSRAGRSLFP